VEKYGFELIQVRSWRLLGPHDLIMNGEYRPIFCFILIIRILKFSMLLDYKYLIFSSFLSTQKYFGLKYMYITLKYLHILQYPP